MIQALRVALACASTTAFAQSAPMPDGGVPSAPAARRLTVPEGKDDLDEMRRELDAKVESAKKEMREEVRAELATQSVAKGWQEEWAGEKRKLELFVPSGYFRIRPDLFYKFDLGQPADPAGYFYFPHSSLTPVSNRERTTAGVNMRFRFEPTINVSEEVRIKSQIDALDNVILGSTPDYAGTRPNGFSIFSNSQSPPSAGLNSLHDSILVKRVYGEVTTPLGILRFGRMGSHWGLGMLHNDGNCLDCDRGDTVDRVMFVTQPVTDFYVSPMLDWNGIGPTTGRTGEGGQPFPLTNQDQTLSFILVIAKRDTEQQAKTKLQNGLSVFNYGLYFTYRTQKNDPATFYANTPFDPHSPGQLQDPYKSVTTDSPGVFAASYVPRHGSLYIPDLWLKFERKNFRLEFEGAAVLGSFDTRATDPNLVSDPAYNPALNVRQWGAVAQSEFRFLDNGALRLGMEIGFASGGQAPGFGNRPYRTGSLSGPNTVPGDIDGPQYCVQVSATCNVNTLTNFQFNKDYRIDMILWREILGGVTDAVYFKPSISYEVTDGFKLFLSIIYSRAAHAFTTPSTTDSSLGIEMNVGVRYETDDGFFAQFAWGLLFPLGGLQQTQSVTIPVSTDTAQALRGMLGIRF